MGYENFDNIFNKSFKPLNVLDFQYQLAKDAVILDTRPPHLFELGFIKGSINIGLNGDFAPWVSSLIDYTQSILIIAEEGKEKDVIMQLLRIGYEDVIGYLEGGIGAWKSAGNNVDMIESIDAFDFCYLFDTTEYKIIDVRSNSESAKEKVLTAILIPLSDFTEKIEELDRNDKYIIYCVGGYRSMVAASIMKQKGFNNVMNVSGGIIHLKQAVPALIH